MAWSADFRAMLADRALQPRFVLERLAVHNEPGASWSAGSSRELGADARIALRGVQVQGQTLSPRTWSSTVGAWSVQLVGDLLELAGRITKGTICRLRCGFGAMAPSTYEVIAVGQLRAIRGPAAPYTLEFVDLYSAFRSRLEVGYGLHSIFADVPASTTVSSTYVVGATELLVGSTTAFSSETGQPGMVQVTPSSGAAFLLSYTGVATGPTRFTGVSVAMGSTSTTAVVGSAVREVAYLTGHPIDIARKILVSRGSGANGAYDTLPSSWGLGVLDGLLDHDDMDTWRDQVVVPSSGAHEWEYAQLGEADDAYAWLQALVAPVGCFLAVRQGRLTVRAAQAPAVRRHHTGIEITDADIAEVASYDAWDQGHSPEYHYLVVRGETVLIGSADTDDSRTLPADSSYSLDLSDRLFDNESAVANEVLERMDPYYRQVPERLVVRCAGRRLAVLAVGDLVDLTTRRCHSRALGSAGFDGRVALVDEVSPDWVGGTVTVGLLVYPTEADAP